MMEELPVRAPETLADTVPLPEVSAEAVPEEQSDEVEVAVRVPVVEAVPELMLVSVPRPDRDDVPVIRPVEDAQRDVIAVVLLVAVGEPVELRMEVVEAALEAVLELVVEDVQDRSAVEPVVQSDAQPQGEQVALEDAPSSGEKVPEGHSVGVREESGQ